jgi:hypothetical protein
MKALGRLLFTLILIGNLLLLAALSVHVVRSGHQVKVMAKDHLTLLETYEDVSGWSADQVGQHAAFTARLINSGHGDLLPAGAAEAAKPLTSSGAPVSH